MQPKNSNSRRFCSVPQCSTYSTAQTSIHSFPNDPILRQKWKVILKIGKPYSKYMSVCSLHFKDSDYKLGKLYFLNMKF